MAMKTLDRRREEFPTLARGIHLLSHSLGPMPRGAKEAMFAYLDRWEQHVSEDAWSVRWWEISSDVSECIARLLGAQPGTVQMQPCASVAMSVVASCFDFQSEKRRKVVTSALDFPSMGYIWEAQQKIGAKICVVPSCDGVVVPTERIVAEIDESTALVALSHVSYRSSARIDVEAIISKAHDMGAKVVFDVYQSVGAIKIEAKRWNVDFLLGGSIKWLCGGPACGYLYVRPDLIEQLEPRLTGWIAHQAPFDFSHEGQRYDSSVRRFAQGTPNIPGLHSCLAGLQIVEEVGMDTIETESRRRTQWMVQFAKDRSWRLQSPESVDQRGGSVMIYVDDPQPLVAQFAQRKVFVDCRPGVGLRLSPHFFNTDEEVHQAMDILAELMC